MHAQLRRFGIVALAMSLLWRPGPAHAIADPLEPFNRAMFTLNTAVLDYVITPVGEISAAWLPVGIRQAS